MPTGDAAPAGTAPAPAGAIGRALSALLRPGGARTLLFAGPEGAGQLEAARWYAAVANCPAEAEPPCGHCPSCLALAPDEGGRVAHVDYRELAPLAVTRDGRTARRRQIGIDMLVPRPQGHPDPLGPWLMAPPRHLRRVAVVIDADALTEQAANAFLKTLEEPPAHAAVILVAPGPDTLLPTVASRCVVLRFRPRGDDAPDERVAGEVAELFQALSGDLQESFEALMRLELWRTPEESVVDLIRMRARELGASRYLRVDAALTAAQVALSAYAHRDLVLRRLVLELREALA